MSDRAVDILLIGGGIASACAAAEASAARRPTAVGPASSFTRPLSIPIASVTAGEAPSATTTSSTSSGRPDATTS